MPPVLDPNDIYSADRPNALSDVVKDFPERVYVPNTESNTVDVIDPKTFKVIDHFKVGRLPQHVTPSFDLKTLWVLNDKGNSLTQIDPKPARRARPSACSIRTTCTTRPTASTRWWWPRSASGWNSTTPQTMKMEHELWVPCKGVDHMDFSANGRYLIASCEFGHAVIKVDVEKRKLIGRLPVTRRACRRT